MMTKTNIRSLISCMGAILILAMVVLTQGHAQETAAADWSYEVRPGDVLSITVWKEPDLMRQVVVRPDGSMSFPLAGSIQTTGKSVEQLEIIVKERLERYIPDPVVTVTIEQIMGNDVYVIGQVNRPGQFLPPARIDVAQALSLAGGTSPFAQLSNIKILRRIDGKLIAIPFDYGDIEKGKRLNQNIILEPGDVVVVP
jgi:polysaccharide export outer membrane protein